VLDSVNQTIFLRKSGMKIGFGALGEGYAVDRCRVLMQERGIHAGLINATGDMTAWGNRPKTRRGWPIGIADPFRPGRVIKKIWLKESVATSGSYEKYAEIEGVRYSHIINPKTGYPATGLISVTVTGPSAEVANGLSTSIMVMGVTNGKNLLSKFPGYRALLITDKGKTLRF
jgi:thiamine biosynthesis lipoprotein